MGSRGKQLFVGSHTYYYSQVSSLSVIAVEPIALKRSNTKCRIGLVAASDLVAGEVETWCDSCIAYLLSFVFLSSTID
eukprot:948871-Pleurochrysis_carterae.AAC.1